MNNNDSRRALMNMPRAKQTVKSTLCHIHQCYLQARIKFEYHHELPPSEARTSSGELSLLSPESAPRIYRQDNNDETVPAGRADRFDPAFEGLRVVVDGEEYNQRRDCHAGGPSGGEHIVMNAPGVLAPGK